MKIAKAALLAVMLAVALVPVHAQSPQPPPGKASAGQGGFVPVDAPSNAQDTMPAPRLVAIAYGFIWVVLFGYLWSVRRRLAKVEREIETVSRRASRGGRSS
jgi:CcmD family protein